MDHLEVWQRQVELVAFCGRYGGFPPPHSLDCDLRYLRAYADAVAEFIDQESRKR